MLPPPHPEQCITSHKSASSGELQYSTVQYSAVQYSASQVTSLHLAESCRAAERNTMAAVLVREVRFRTQSGLGAWDGELEREMGVTGVSVFLLIACGDSLTATGSGRPFLPYSFSFAWIYIAQSKGKMASAQNRRWCCMLSWS